MRAFDLLCASVKEVLLFCSLYSGVFLRSCINFVIDNFFMERFYVESQSLPNLPNASHFVSGHRFDSDPPFVRLPQMQSVFLVCLSGSVHEIDMSRHGQNSHEVFQ